MARRGLGTKKADCVELVTVEEQEAARAIWAGSPARIPIGRIASGTDVNLGWSWHLSQVTFAEATTAGCDGRPSDVERTGLRFGNGWYCPWSAELVAITFY